MASKLKKMFGNVAKFALPIAGYAVGGPVGAGIGGAIGGAVSGKGAIKRAAIGGATGFGGGALAKGIGVPSMSGGGGGGIGGLLSKFFGGNAFASGAPAAGAKGLSASAMQHLTAGGPSSAGAGIFNSMGSAAANPSSAVGGLNKIGSLFGKNKLLTTGLGLAAGSQFLKSPKVPELPQSVLDYQEMVKGGGSALNQQATGALSTELNRPFEQVSAEEEAAALRQLEKDQGNELESIKDVYRNARPGTDYSTDSAYKRDVADLNDRFARAKTDTVSQLRRQVSNDFQGNRIRQILAAQGIDQNQMTNMLASSQYDVDRMLAQLQIDDRDKQFLRETIFNTGKDLAVNQLDPTNALIQKLIQQRLGTGGVI